MLSPLEQMSAQLGIPVAQLVASPSAVPEAAQEKHTAVRRSPEMERILALPRRPAPGPEVPETVALAEALTLRLQRHPDPYPVGRQYHKKNTGLLRPLQAAGLAEAWRCRGLFGPIRPGYGKLLLSYLLPAVLGAKRPLYVAPASLESEVKREFTKYSQHWRGPHPQHYPFLSYQTLSAKNAGGKKDSRGEVLRVELLERLQPDLLVFDECHKLRHSDTVVQKRVKRYLQNHPETVVCALSGTATRRSLKDFSHIMRWCLRELAPLPSTWSDLEAWADALDQKDALGPRTEIGALTLLCTAEDHAAIAAARGGYDEAEAVRGIVRGAVRRRMVETPGVIATQDGPLDVPLDIHEWSPPKQDPAIEDAFTTLRALWETPAGMPVVDGLELARHAKSLGLGFFQHWFDEGAFRACLQRTLNSGELTTASEVRTPNERKLHDAAIRRILSNVANATEHDTALVKAVGSLASPKQENEPTISPLATDLLLSSTMKCSPDSTELATSAGTSAQMPTAGATQSKPRSLSTTATQQEKSEGCSAAPAMQHSAYWATTLRDYPALLRIFKEAIQAAQPPEEWLSARSNWAKFCRDFVTNNKRDIDSEAQVKDAIRSGQVKDFGLLAKWEDVRPVFDPELHSTTEWISNEAVGVVQDWLKEHSGIIWVSSIELGRKLERELGVPYYGAEGLTQAGKFILDHPPGQSMVASKGANGTGRHLVAWEKNLWLTTPCEQSLARTHRPGTNAEVVQNWVYIGCREDAAAYWKGTSAARYAQQLTGQAQRLCYATVTVPSLDEVEARSTPRWCR